MRLTDIMSNLQLTAYPVIALILFLLIFVGVLVYTFSKKRRQPRIPFGALLQQGLVEPGQKLFFGKRADIAAIVLANGKIKHNGYTGSIHQVGTAIRQAPCNGWEHWYYLDEATGEPVVIDELRKVVRAQQGEDVL